MSLEVAGYDREPVDVHPVLSVQPTEGADSTLRRLTSTNSSRDPLQRTYSHWKERHRNDAELLSFADALVAEPRYVGYVGYVGHA